MKQIKLIYLLLITVVIFSCRKQDATPPLENTQNEDLAGYVEVASINLGGLGAAEITAFDPTTDRLFAVNNSAENKIDVIDMSNPAILKVIKSISMLPFGGYVKVAGIIDESMDAKLEYKPYELMSKPKWQQIWFMSAGVIMNTILAFFIFMGLYNYTGRPVSSNEPIINEVIADTPAFNAGFKSGDKITSIEGSLISTWNDLTNEVSQRPNQEIALVYLREGKLNDIKLITSFQINPETGDTLGMMGVRPSIKYQAISILESIQMSSIATARGFGLVILSIKMISSGQASVKDLGGPIMIAQLAGETAKAGMIPFFSLMALISCNLAFLNILPIPGLDGGHIFITIIEGIIRRPLSIKMRMAIQQVGMVLLLMLMVTVIINDVGRLFNN